MTEKVQSVLEHGDEITIGGSHYIDGSYYIDVYFRDFNDFENRVYERVKAEAEIGKKWPVTYSLNDGDGNLVCDYEGTPYISGGVYGGDIYKENLENQRKDIKHLTDDLPSIILNKINENEAQNKRLNESLESLEGKEITPVQVKEVVAHSASIPFPGGNSVQIVYRDIDDREGNYKKQPYTPQHDESERNNWPITYILKDKDGQVIDTFINDREPYISGGKDHGVNLERQNNMLKKISEKLKDTIQDKIYDNEEHNHKLSRDYDDLEENYGKKPETDGPDF